mgnify:CR=1 FL=1
MRQTSPASPLPCRCCNQHLHQPLAFWGGEGEPAPALHGVRLSLVPAGLFLPVIIVIGRPVRHNVDVAAGSACAQPSGWRSGPKPPAQVIHSNDPCNGTSSACNGYIHRRDCSVLVYRAVQPRRTAAWLFVGAELLTSAVQGAASSQRQQCCAHATWWPTTGRLSATHTCCTLQPHAARHRKVTQQRTAVGADSPAHPGLCCQRNQVY